MQRIFREMDNVRNAPSFDESSTDFFEALPIELLCKISVDHVDFPKDILSLTRTCRKFRLALDGPIPKAAWLWRKSGYSGLRRTRSVEVIRRLVEFHMTDAKCVLHKLREKAWCLTMACARSDDAIVEYLLSMSDSMHLRGDATYATYATYADVAKRIASIGFATEAYENTPDVRNHRDTYAAVRVLRLMLDNAPGITIDKRKDILKKAINDGRTDFVAVMLEHPDFKNASLREHLIHASSINADIVGQLLEHAGMNAQDAQQAFVTVAETSDARAKVVERLAAHPDVDVNAAIHGAAFYGSGALGFPTTALGQACRMRDIDRVRVLLANPRIDVNACPHGGQSALMVACLVKHDRRAIHNQHIVAILKELLNHPGINACATHMRTTALQNARNMGATEAVDLLLHHAPGY